MASTKRYRVDDFDIEVSSRSADLLIYCVGYESRSAHILLDERWADAKGAAIVYRDRRTGSFQANLALCASRCHQEWSDDPVELSKALDAELGLLKQGPCSIRVSVDVSAMDRGVMALVMLKVLSHLRTGDFLDLLYSPAEFHSHEPRFLPVRRYGPAHPLLAGRLQEPLPQTCLILGLGFEYGVALNVIDSHDPDDALLFAPQGFDKRYDDAVREANFRYEFGRDRVQVSHYPLSSPRSLFDALSSIVQPIKGSAKIVFAPMGPKIFSAVSILQAYLHRPHVSLLRYSITTDENLHDVKASGEIVGLSLQVRDLPVDAAVES